MKDIAEKLNISTATVSRVLGKVDDPFISEATKKKVREAALYMGYKKNIVAQALTNGKTNLIEIQVPFGYAGLNAQFLSLANKTGYQLTFRDIEAMYIYNSHFSINTFMSDGIISIITGSLLDELVSPNSPCVSIGDKCSLNFDHIIFNLYDGTKSAVEYLIKNGCKRIAYIADELTDIESEARCKAYKDVLNGAGMEPCFIMSKDYDDKTVFDFLLEYLKNGLDFDGAFCHSNNRAQALHRALLLNGYKIPDDVSVIGVSETNAVDFITPSITTIDIDYGQVALTAWDFLMKRINEPDMPLQEASCGYKLNLRESTR